MNTRYEHEIDSHEQKILPNSMQAEQAVLGSLMMDNNTWGSVADLITTNDFYRPNHKLIFNAIEFLALNAMPFDLITLHDELKKSRDLDRIGGIPYLNLLIENTPTVANIVAYAKILKDKTHLRDLIRIGTEIAESAFEGKTEYAESKLLSIETKEEQPEAQEWVSDLSADIDFMIPAHFGIAADIQRWILDTSVKKQPAIALAATLSILSVVVGRHRNCDGIKGNIISVCLAESGEGKDHPLKCVDKILNAIGMGGNISGQLASGAALFEAVNRKKSVVLMLDEMGHYFTGIQSKGANQYSKEIMPMITEMYTSANYQFRDKARAGREGEIIKEPNLSVIGMTTERQIIDSLRSSDVADGSLARFFVLFGNNNVLINPDSDKLNSNEVPQGIIDALESLKSEYGGNDDMFLGSKLLPISDDYRALKMQLMVDFNNKGIACGKEGGNSAIFKPFYARLAVKAVCIALLIDQCQSVEVLQWCADLVEKAQDVFVKKFLHLAADNENERLVKIVERAIKEAGKKGITKKELYSKTRQVPTLQKKLIIEDLIDSEKIFSALKRIDGSPRSSNCYFWRK